MALSIRHIGAGSVALGVSNTIVATLTDGAAVGELVSGWATVQSSGTLTSVSDTGGNTWTARSAFVSGTLRYYWVDCVLTTALAIGDTISVLCSTGSGRKLASFSAINGQDASYFDQQGAGQAGSSNSPSITTGVPAQADSVILCGIYSALTTVTVEDADFTALGNVGVENRNMHTAARIISAAAADTYAPTLGAAQSWDTNYIIYKAAGGAPPAATSSDLALLGVG